MLNPSTADADKDDPTIRRCIGFAEREGAGGIVVVNLFAFRATNPGELDRAADPFGPDNGAALRRVGEWSKHTGGKVICAWGTMGWLRKADDAAIATLSAAGAKMFCFGRSKAGFPRHPLYLLGTTPLQGFAR